MLSAATQTVPTIYKYQIIGNAAGTELHCVLKLGAEYFGYVVGGLLARHRL